MATTKGGMLALDEVFGRFDSTTNNPFGGLPSAGAQWPEERAFARIANPHALARLTQVLCGMQGLVIHGGDAGDSAIKRGINLEDRKRYAEAIGTTIACLVELCPDMFSYDEVEVDPDFDIAPYRADERMKGIVARAFERAGLDVPPILIEEDL